MPRAFQKAKVAAQQTLIADLTKHRSDKSLERGSEAWRFPFHVLGVPTMRNDQAVGVLTLTRTEARQFTDKQIELVAIFADQAAIAIENVRRSMKFRKRASNSRRLHRLVRFLRN